MPMTEKEATIKALNNYISNAVAAGNQDDANFGQAKLNELTGGNAQAPQVAPVKADATPAATGFTDSDGGVPPGLVLYSSAANGTGGGRTQGQALEKELKGLYSGDGAYSMALMSMLQANKAATDQAVSELQGQKVKTEQSYGDMFKQLYRQKMQARKNIGQVMAAQGVTGGASESTALGLETGYAEALRQGEQERINAQNELDRAITQAKLTGKIQDAQAISDNVRDRTNSYAGVLQGLLNGQDSWAMHDANMEYQKDRDSQNDLLKSRQDIRNRINTYLQGGGSVDALYATFGEDAVLASGLSRGELEQIAADVAKGESVTTQKDVRDRIDSFLSAGGSVDALYAALGENTVAASGLTRGELEQIASYYAKQNAPNVTYSGGGGGTPKAPEGSIYERMYAAGVTAPGDVAAYLIDEGYSESEVNTLTAHYDNWYKQQRWDGDLANIQTNMDNGVFGTSIKQAQQDVWQLVRTGKTDAQIAEYLDQRYPNESQLSNAGLQYLLYWISTARG